MKMHCMLTASIKKVKYAVDHSGGAHLNYDSSKGFRIEPILEAAGMTNRWIEKGILVVDSAAPLYAPQEGDVKENGISPASNFPAWLMAGNKGSS